MISRQTIGVILPLLLITNCANAGIVTSFTIVDSSASSWVARGYNNYTVSPESGWTFHLQNGFLNEVEFIISGSPLPGTAVDSWRLDFAAPFGGLLTPGFYPNVQRSPDATHAGLGFTSTGRGDNQAAGSFEILEATFSPSGELKSFSANFTHYGEATPANYAIGEIRFNVTSVPEPNGAVLVASMLLILAAKRLRTNRFRGLVRT